MEPKKNWPISRPRTESVFPKKLSMTTANRSSSVSRTGSISNSINTREWTFSEISTKILWKTPSRPLETSLPPPPITLPRNLISQLISQTSRPSKSVLSIKVSPLKMNLPPRLLKLVLNPAICSKNGRPNSSNEKLTLSQQPKINKSPYLLLR